MLGCPSSLLWLLSAGLSLHLRGPWDLLSLSPQAVRFPALEFHSAMCSLLSGERVPEPFPHGSLLPRTLPYKFRLLQPPEAPVPFPFSGACPCLILSLCPPAEQLLRRSGIADRCCCVKGLNVIVGSLCRFPRCEDRSSLHQRPKGRTFRKNPSKLSYTFIRVDAKPMTLKCLGALSAVPSSSHSAGRNVLV